LDWKIGDTIVLINDVPADVCTNYRHYYLSSETTKLVLEKETEAYNKGVKLEVVKLQMV